QRLAEDKDVYAPIHQRIRRALVVWVAVTRRNDDAGWRERRELLAQEEGCVGREVIGIEQVAADREHVHRPLACQRQHALQAAAQAVAAGLAERGQVVRAVESAI